MSQNNLYEVKWCKDLGRYLVASQDIQPREIIIREDPLVTGPTDRGPKGVPVCLGCCGVMFDNPLNRCMVCHWPVCSEACGKLPSHATNECLIFNKNRVVYPPPNTWPYISKSIVILRCLLLKTNNPSKWQLLMNMADNKDVRQGKPKCIYSDKKILENFAKFMPEHDNTGDGTDGIGGGGRSWSSSCTSGASTNEQGFLEEEVIQISGIIDTNAHAFPLSINGRSVSVCNLYSQTSLVAHSCLPNASWSPDKSLSSLSLTIRANVLIAKGDIISVAYDDGQLLVCTLKRLVPNEINGMFICNCKRCLDPTELGTYIGGLKCPSCQEGYLLPIDPVDSFSSWKCDTGTDTRKRRNYSGSNNNDDNNGNGKSDTNLGNFGVDDERPHFSSSADGDGRKANGSNSNIGEGNNGKEDKESGNCNEVLDDESVMEIMEEAESLCGYTKINLGSAEPLPQNPIGEEEQKAREEDESLELLKEFVKEYSGNILHPNHYILQEANVRILKGDYAKGLNSLSDSDLIQYLQRCERLLGIANVLTPGFCEYRAFLQFHFSQGLLSLEKRKRKNGKHQQQYTGGSRGAKGKDETSHDVDDDDDCANKLKQESTTSAHGDDNDGGGDDDQNGNDDVISTKKTKDKQQKSFAEYENSQRNLERLMEMLTFLLAFCREINPDHNLLQPITDTIEDTEDKLEKLTSTTRIRGEQN